MPGLRLPYNYIFDDISVHQLRGDVAAAPGRWNVEYAAFRWVDGTAPHLNHVGSLSGLYFSVVVLRCVLRDQDGAAADSVTFPFGNFVALA
jgi:hypothetical protein